MKLRLTFALAFLAGFNLFAALPTEYESRKADAEKFFTEGSFAKAREVYASLILTNLLAADQRWVQFRLADTPWRPQAATQPSDTTKLDQARQQLEILIRDLTREEDHDRVWVEVQESLADFFWVRRDNKD